MNALARDLDLPVMGELGVATGTGRRSTRCSTPPQGPGENSEASSGFDIEGSIIASGHLSGVIERELTGAGLIGVEVVGSWGAGHGDVRGIGLANSDSAFYVDAADLSVGDDAALARWLADPDVPKAMHGAKGPTQAIWDRGWDIRGLASDTHLAAYVLRPDQRVFDLADLSLRYLGRELTPGPPGRQNNRRSTSVAKTPTTPCFAPARSPSWRESWKRSCDALGSGVGA